MNKYFLLLLLTVMPLASAMAETYEQAFVACSEQVASQDGDHKAAIDACLKAKGFTPEADDSAGQ